MSEVLHVKVSIFIWFAVTPHDYCFLLYSVDCSGKNVPWHNKILSLLFYFLFSFREGSKAGGKELILGLVLITNNSSVQ